MDNGQGRPALTIGSAEPVAKALGCRPKRLPEPVGASTPAIGAPAPPRPLKRRLRGKQGEGKAPCALVAMEQNMLAGLKAKGGQKVMKAKAAKPTGGQKAVKAMKAMKPMKEIKAKDGGWKLH